MSLHRLAPLDRVHAVKLATNLSVHRLLPCSVMPCHEAAATSSASSRPAWQAGRVSLQYQPPWHVHQNSSLAQKQTRKETPACLFVSVLPLLSNVQSTHVYMSWDSAVHIGQEHGVAGSRLQRLRNGQQQLPADDGRCGAAHQQQHGAASRHDFDASQGGGWPGEALAPHHRHGGRRRRRRRRRRAEGGGRGLIAGVSTHAYALFS